MKNIKSEKLIALLNCHDDDVYCFRKELIESFIQEGYKVLISCPYGEKLKLIENIEYDFVDTPIDRRGKNPVKDFKLFLTYIRIFKKYKPDIILTYTIKPNIYGSMAARFLKIPYINNVTGLGIVTRMSKVVKGIMMFLLKQAFKKSSCVFFQNEENYEMARNYKIITGESKLIPGSGVNIDKFHFEPYPDDSDMVIFNYIGRVLKDKGVDDYFEAAKEIKKRHKNVEFNIIGFVEPRETQYIDTLKELEIKDILVYRGNQKDVRPFIARSHCMIHPSTYGEGMSNVLLENAAMGRPAITTDIAGCREIVRDGVNGFLYPAGEVHELVKEIEKFLSISNTERKNMGIEGRKKIEKLFNRQIVVNEYSEEIKKLIGHS